jgi:Mrp family chromosome partitioning ATPase/uncharacterized protein involved in exopolysaccharide biosynthesis
MSGFDPTNLPSRGIKPLVSLLAYPKLAIITFLVVLIAGIPLVFIKGTTLYATTATLQVAPRYMKNLRDDGELSFPSNTQYREFLEQQIKSLTRYDIVQDSLRSLGSKADFWRLKGESERGAVERLRAQIDVHAIPDTYMMEVSLQTAKKEGLADIVNAVINTYVERMKLERVYGSDLRNNNLVTREAELVGLIQQKTNERSEISLKLGISAFTGTVENPYDRVLNELRSNLADARNKRFDAEAKLHAFELHGETDLATRSIQEAVLVDPGLNNLKSNLYTRRTSLLNQLSGLKPQHPAYKELSNEIKFIENEIDKQTNSLSSQIKGGLLARYQTTVAQSREIEKDTQQELAQSSERGAEFAQLYSQAMTLTLNIDQDRKELETVRDRINELKAEVNSLGFVRVVSPALPPELPFGAGKKKIFIMVLVAAFFAGLVAPTGRDLLDRSVHTVNDAERVLGIPALGWMVETSDSPSRLLGEDLLRRIAGGLLHEKTTNGTHIFAFSSVKPGAGSTKLSLDLACTLNKLGYPTLIVEANAFMPHGKLRTGSDENIPGLAQCLLGEVSPADCIIPATEGLPDRVWVGNVGENRHIDHLDRLENLTATWSEKYQFILIDIPPLLLSADAEILARKLEHLLLIVEAGGISGGELRRTARQIEKLKLAAVGVIVNRIRPFEGGGYLRDMQVEYLTGRKAATFLNESLWLIGLRNRLAGWKNWRPKYFKHTDK